MHQLLGVGLVVSAVATLGSGCRSKASKNGGDGGGAAPSPSTSAPATSTPAAATASGAPPTSAAPAASAPAPCVAPKLQPGRCARPDGPIRARDVAAWFEAHGVAKAAATAWIDKSTVSRCEELDVGARGPRGLACVTEDPVHVYAKLGPSSPAQIEHRLLVLAPRDGRVVELAAAPLGVMSSESDLLFRAIWRVDAAEGILRVETPADDCRTVKPRLDAYWDAKKPGANGDRDLLGAIEAERKRGLARIEAVCRAPGSHPFK